MKKSVLISSFLTVVVIGGLAYWLLSDKNAPGSMSAEVVNNQDKNPNAIANKWQWENFSSDKSVANSDAKKTETKTKTEKKPSDLEGQVSYDVIEIYNLLQSITLDETGGVIPDETAKQALENGFMSLGPDLSQEAMSELQDLIRIGLPGEAGEQAANILENYYQFRLAEVDFNQQMANALPASEAESGQMADTL